MPFISRESCCQSQMLKPEPTCLGRWVNQILWKATAQHSNNLCVGLPFVGHKTPQSSNEWPSLLEKQNQKFRFKWLLASLLGWILFLAEDTPRQIANNPSCPWSEITKSHRLIFSCWRTRRDVKQERVPVSFRAVFFSAAWDKMVFRHLRISL